MNRSGKHKTVFGLRRRAKLSAWLSFAALGTFFSVASVEAATKQLAVFEPKVEGAKLSEADKQMLDGAIQAAVEDLGFVVVPRTQVDETLTREGIRRCDSADCWVKVGRSLEAMYVLTYKVKLAVGATDSASGGGGKKGKGKAAEEPPPGKAESSLSGAWKFEASLFNVSLAATADEAKDQKRECANCNIKQAGDSLGELARSLLVAAQANLRGTIDITTKPAGAEVYVDGALQQGVTQEGKPLSIKTLAGKRRVRVKRADYQSYEEDVAVAENTSTPLTLTLTPIDLGKVVYVRQPRPAWRLAAGVIGLVGGGAMITFGGLLWSINGKPGLVDGQEDLTRKYSTAGVGAGLTVPGAVFAAGGLLLLAIPGPKKVVSDTRVAPAQSLSLGRVGTGTGLVFGTAY